MFDMGFSELLLVGIVGLLVIGPERLPGAIRTTMVWVNRIRRSFNEVRADVERELHNDAVMKELRDNASTLKEDVASITEPVRSQLSQIGGELRHDLHNDLHNDLSTIGTPVEHNTDTVASSPASSQTNAPKPDAESDANPGNSEKTLT